MKRFVSLFLTLALLLTVCAMPVVAESTVDTSKEVTLTMYLLGDRTPDFDMVFDKINESMKEKINATLEVKFLSWGEYEKKYPLLFAAGDDFDIIYSADWAFYNAQSTKQGFWEITQEALDTYAPMTAESIFPEAWEAAKVDGKVYMLPQNNKELSGYVYMVRGDLMEKHGIEDIQGIDGMEKYWTAIAENEKQLIPIDVGSDYDAFFLFDRLWTKATTGVSSGIGPWQVAAHYMLDDAEYTAKHNSENENFLPVIQKLKEWKDKGFWSQSAVVNTMNNTESFTAGRSASALMNLNTALSIYASVLEQHPDWDVKVIDAMDGVPATLVSPLGNGMSIFSKSKNPERALMALDLLRNDEEINGLFCYGIEDVHYKDNGDGTLTLLEKNGDYGYDANCNWGVRNSAIWKRIAGGIPNYSEIYDKWVETATMGTELSSLNFNDASVKNQIAAMNDIFQSDYKLLCLGFSENPEADIAKLQKKLEAADAQAVYAELSAQAKAFMQNLEK